MKPNIREIILEAVCGFNIEIDKGQMSAAISIPCDEPCEYCEMFADHICQQIEEGQDDE